MTSELFTIFGSNKAASTSGNCSGAVAVMSGYFNLTSPIFSEGSWVSGTTPNSIVIPKGTVFKIWEEKLSVNYGTARSYINVSNNSGVSYTTISKSGVTATSGTNQVTIRRTGRPLVIPCGNGTSGYTMVQFEWNSDAATGGITAEYIAEIVELND